MVKYSLKYKLSDEQKLGVNIGSYAIAGEIGSVGFRCFLIGRADRKTNTLRLPLLHIASGVSNNLKKTKYESYTKRNEYSRSI